MAEAVKTTGPAARRAPRRLDALLGPRPLLLPGCLLVWTLTNMDQGLFGYVIPGILAEFKLPLQTVGTILTVSFLAGSVLVVIAGLAADRFGGVPVLAVLLAVSALMVGLQGLAGGIVTLTLFRAAGFGLSAGLSPITNALVAQNAPARLRGLAMGVLQCGYPLGWLLGSLFAAPLLQRHGWRSTCFVAFAVIPLTVPVLAMLSGGGKPAARHLVRPEAGGVGARLRLLFGPAHRRSSLATMAIFFLFGGAYAGSAFFFPTFFTQARGYTPSQAASLVGLSNGIAVFGYMSAAVIGEFLVTRRTVFVLWCLGGAAALIGLLFLSHGRLQDTLWYGLTAGLFFGSQAVFIVLAAELVPESVRTTALAVCCSAPISLGFALFPLATPAPVAAAGWPGGLAIAIVPPLVGAGLIALLLPNRRSGQGMPS